MKRLGWRHAAYGLALTGLLMACAGVALVALGPFDLASGVARRAGRSLGRPVAIAALQVRVGAAVTVQLRGLVIDNLPGSSPGPFLRLDRLDAEMTPWSVLGWALFDRPPLVRHLAVDGVHLLLEHAADGRPNWYFGEPGAATGTEPRARLPTLLDARLGDGDVEIHTSGGQTLAIRLDAATLAAAGSDQPMTLAAHGTYNALPVALSATLQSFDRLHDAAVPFGARVHLASDDTLVDFDGTSTRPVRADGVSGTIRLTAPSLDRLLAIGGTGGRFAAPVSLGGGFSRDGDLWRLTDGVGTLDAQPVRLVAQLKEGGRHAPDDITLDAGFARLDLTPLRGASKAGDTALRVDADPGTLLDARVAAKQVVYGDFQVDAVDLAAKLAPGALTVDHLAGRFAGGAVQIGGTVTNADAGAVVRLDGALTGADPRTLAGVLGLGTLPITGAVDVRFGLDAAGSKGSGVAGSVHGGLALSMQGGSIARDILEMASTDVRRLFRKSDALDRVSCLFGLVDFTDGVGRVAPLRLRTPDGTLVGAGTVDLRRDTLDLTFATESATTSVFALDVPVRFAGPIEAPHVLPALGGPRPGRPDLDHLSPAVQDLARGNPCLMAER